MSIVKVGWSGGKDSTAAILLHLQRGDKVKAVCYIPMFTKEIPLILKDQYKFILNTSNYFRSIGVEVFIVNGITYIDYVLHKAIKGKNKGKIFGYPYCNNEQCGFKRDSKIKACKNIDIGYYDYESIGIAYDEINRHNQLNEKHRSILVEEKYTQKDNINLCIKHNLFSPVYSNRKRDGCALCYNASAFERRQWFYDYPKAFDIVLKLQEIIKIEKPGIYPLRNYRYFIEPNNQISLFDDKKYIIN